MGLLITVVLVSALAVVAVRSANSPHVVTTREPLADFSTLSKAEWREDVTNLARNLPGLHKNAFADISRGDFDDAVQSLLHDIPTLDGDEAAVRIMQLVTLIGDAHTGASAYASDASRYPLALTWFKDGLFVTQATGDGVRALGAKVTGIGSLSVDDAYTTIASVIPHENEPWLRRVSEMDLVNARLLRVLRIAPTAESAAFSFEDRDGRRFELELKPLPDGASGLSWSDASPARPLYRQRPTEAYWFSYLADSQTMYLKYNSCRDSAAFGQLAAQMWAEVDSKPVQRLIVDLRGNGGGDSRVFSPILTGIAARPALNQRGRVYAVTDRRTFSSGMLNTIDLREGANALVYGEPTGGKPNSYGDIKTFYLPNSHIPVTYSTKYFRPQEEDTASVMPDVTIELTSADYVAGRDPVLEAILSSQPK